MFTMVSQTSLGSLSSRANEGYVTEKRFHDYLREKDLLKGFVSFVHKPVITRTEIYDEIVYKEILKKPYLKVLNMGCGFCGRFFRLNNQKIFWVDFDDQYVIDLRKACFDHNKDSFPYNYGMVGGDIRDGIPDGFDLYIAEGSLMYISEEAAKATVKGNMVFDVIGKNRTVPLGVDQLWKYDEARWAHLNVIEKYAFDEPKRSSIILHVLQNT